MIWKVPKEELQAQREENDFSTTEQTPSILERSSYSREAAIEETMFSNFFFGNGFTKSGFRHSKKKSDSPLRITICHRRRKIYLRFRGDLRRVVQKPLENSCTVERGAASEKEEQPVGAIALKKTVAIYSNTILFCKVRLCNNQSN